MARTSPHARRAGQTLLSLDWGQLSPLRVKARAYAEGLYAGQHPSTRRGAGIEFAGHRPYVVGDDLRFLDRRSLLKHDRLMVRQFETDTDRALWLVLDATASMAYRGEGALGAKLAYGALLGAALARVAIAGGDPVGLSWFGSGGLRELSAASGYQAFERLVDTLETAVAQGDWHDNEKALAAVVRRLARRALRGSVIVVLSDLLDLAPDARRIVAALGARGRVLVVIQLLDPEERDLSFKGKLRLRAMEGDARVVTDADVARDGYLRNLREHTAKWTQAVNDEGGRLVRVATDESPLSALRAVLHAIAGVRR